MSNDMLVWSTTFCVFLSPLYYVRQVHTMVEIQAGMLASAERLDSGDLRFASILNSAGISTLCCVCFIRR